MMLRQLIVEVRITVAFVIEQIKILDLHNTVNFSNQCHQVHDCNGASLHFQGFVPDMAMLRQWP